MALPRVPPGRRRPILDRPRVLYEPDATGRRRTVRAADRAAHLPVRIAILLDAGTYLTFLALHLARGSLGVALWLSAPPATVWALADLAAWEGSRGGLKARVALAGVVVVAAVRPLLLLAVGDATSHAADDPELGGWWVGAVAVAVAGAAACLSALARPRESTRRAAPPPGEAPGPWPAPDVVEPASVTAPPARAPGRAARLLGAFGLAWILAGVVEATRAIFWFGFVEVAVGVGWFLCQDTILDRRTDSRLLRTDRSSVLPLLLVPLGGIAVLARAVWLLANR